MTLHNPRLASLMFFGWLSAAGLVTAASPAFACGDAEASSCEGPNGAADEARWMLNRVAAAVQANEPQALDDFTHGRSGFRTQDTYVFCIGPNGRMSAHPDQKLIGQDARTLRDPNGKPFAAEMIDSARPGRVAEVSYLYPRPGSDRPVPKTSFVTRVKDQVCGVGYYDTAVSSETPPAAATLTLLRQHLDAEMPAVMRPDWTAFLRALDDQQRTEEAAVTKARQSLETAQATLGATIAQSSR